jgi:histidinol-phosphate aminotransferase
MFIANKITKIARNNMISERAKQLNPYVPGEQPKDRDYIKINANENPYPPSKAVKKALCSFVKNNIEKLGLYPDPDSEKLHEAIADMLNKTGGVLSRAKVKRTLFSSTVEPSEKDKIPFTVTSDMIYTGNGSDEVLSFVFYAFFDSDVKLVRPEFSYSFYPVYCGFYNIPSDVVPLKSDWSLDVETMLDKANKNHSSIIFANPNAPTGLSLTREQIRNMILRAPQDRVFVVDEAYVDFGGESCIPLLQEFKNLVVVRTFSKSLCGAGMRNGYLVAAPELVQAVTTVKNSMNHFPMDAITQVAGVASCEDAGYYAECASKIANTRARFSKFLLDRGWFVLPSSTNFVFVKKDGVSGKKVYEEIKKQGILVRRFDTKGIEDFLRITIGTDKQMDKLEKIMDSFSN